MKLYRSSTYSTRWFAFGPDTGWVMFPAEVGGWSKREAARGVDRAHLREVPLRLGFNTGIPGAAAFIANRKPKLKVTCLTCGLMKCIGLSVESCGTAATPEGVTRPGTVTPLRSRGCPGGQDSRGLGRIHGVLACGRGHRQPRGRRSAQFSII